MNIEVDKQKYIDLNRLEYGNTYSTLRFPTTDECHLFMAAREDLLQKLDHFTKWDFNKTKTDTTYLSPGCRLCGEGYWSCLFMNNRCNTRCFYCPAKQDGQSLPGTSSLDFKRPEDYADYVQLMGFKGVSISGGEPFLDFEKSLLFIKTLRKQFGNDLYLWLYTNGILADQTKLKQLAAAGLNEIRFDISATNYSLEKPALAAGIIENITIEIPTIPEDIEIVKNLLPLMQTAGVNYLNLHQIRATGHNARNLVNRGYTFLHGAKVTVMESELAALRILLFARENGITLPINYCSFIYRNRFQTRAARSRHANLIKQSYEDITEAGTIRTMWIVETAEQIKTLTETLSEKNIAPENWYFHPGKSALYFNQTALSILLPFINNLKVSYHISFLLPSVSYRRSFKKIMLNDQFSIVIERTPVFENFELSKDDVRLFYDTFIQISGGQDLYQIIEKSNNLANQETHTLISRWKDVYFYEKIKTGLYEYY